MEAGSGLTTDLSQSRPEDILVQDRDAVSEAAELRKHTANDAKCAELRWVSIPLVVEYYGAWSKEAQLFFIDLHLTLLSTTVSYVHANL